VGHTTYVNAKSSVSWLQSFQFFLISFFSTDRLKLYRGSTCVLAYVLTWPHQLGLNSLIYCIISVLS
jgi:hypothetical protein